LFDAAVDRIGFINNGCLFKAEYNDRSKKALAFFKIAIAEAIVLHSSFRVLTALKTPFQDVIKTTFLERGYLI